MLSPQELVLNPDFFLDPTIIMMMMISSSINIQCSCPHIF